MRLLEIPTLGQQSLDDGLLSRWNWYYSPMQQAKDELRTSALMVSIMWLGSMNQTFCFGGDISIRTSSLSNENASVHATRAVSLLQRHQMTVTVRSSVLSVSIVLRNFSSTPIQSGLNTGNDRKAGQSGRMKSGVRVSIKAAHEQSEL